VAEADVEAAAEEEVVEVVELDKIVVEIAVEARADSVAG
jgi:hypothetical protein